MRPTIWVSLVAVCLLEAVARAQVPAPEKPAAKARVVWTDEASGYGQNKTDARHFALEGIQAKVAARLREEMPGLGWTPSADDLQRWDAVQDVRSRPDTPEPGSFEVRLRVTLTEDTVQKIVGNDHRQRVQERQLLAAKVLAALVALLALGAGYFRLEELTRGYYTGVLRLLLLGSAGAIGAGLWLVL